MKDPHKVWQTLTKFDYPLVFVFFCQKNAFTREDAVTIQHYMKQYTHCQLFLHDEYHKNFHHRRKSFLYP